MLDLTKAAALLAMFLLTGATARAETPPPVHPPPHECGYRPSDWCPSPEGDPCGRHADEAACRADPQCIGMRYRGTSFVSCMPDGRGFWSNCPAVGCITKPIPEVK